MLKNNIALISKNTDNIKILKDIITNLEANIYTYDSIEDLKQKTPHMEMDAVFCYYEELGNISDVVNLNNVFLIDSDFNEEHKKIVYENSIYEYLFLPINSMDVLHRLAIINQQKLERFNNNSACISVLTQLVNIKDGDNNGHLVRMRNIVGLFLEELLKHDDYKHRLSESLCYEITQASLLHDIGKMVIPDHILHKTGSLTFEEFDSMRQHTDIGHQILSTTYNKFASNNIIKLAIDIAQSHHERWNGNGYPQNLKGEDIPLNARIVAICDVYDSIISSNSYKSSSTHEHALESIILESGMRFDPNLVNVFKNIGDSIKQEKQSRFTKMRTYHKPTI